MGASVRRGRRAAGEARELPRYRVPQHWGRQLGGTLREQLSHLRQVLAPRLLAEQLTETGLSRQERVILAQLRCAKSPLRPRAIEERVGVDVHAVQACLTSLEPRALARRQVVETRGSVVSYEWSAA